MSELVVEPFTNSFGQVIKPGDEIIFAGTGWKNTTIRKGVFGGVHYANVTRTQFIKDENGALVTEERTAYNGSKYIANKSESVTTREVVSVRVEQVNRGFKYDSGYDEDGKYFYKKTDQIRYGVSTLPLKRVYKLDTSFSEFAGQSF